MPSVSVALSLSWTHLGLISSITDIRRDIRISRGCVDIHLPRWELIHEARGLLSPHSIPGSWAKGSTRLVFFFFAGFAEGKARCNYAAALPFHPSLFSVTVCQILGSSVSVSEILGTFFCRFGCTKSRTGASQTIQTALWAFCQGWAPRIARSQQGGSRISRLQIFETSQLFLNLRWLGIDVQSQDPRSY